MGTYHPHALQVSQLKSIAQDDNQDGATNCAMNMLATAAWHKPDLVANVLKTVIMMRAKQGGEELTVGHYAGGIRSAEAIPERPPKRFL